MLNAFMEAHQENNRMLRMHGSTPGKQQDAPSIVVITTVTDWCAILYPPD
jgi:hypothetical protein